MSFIIRGATNTFDLTLNHAHVHIKHGLPCSDDQVCGEKIAPIAHLQHRVSKSDLSFLPSTPNLEKCKQLKSISQNMGRSSVHMHRVTVPEHRPVTSGKQVAQ